jgi:molybdenum cofactor biosynthesis enzyme MoaA
MQDPDPNNSYKFTLATWPRGRQERQPITNSCNRPFKTVEIDMFTNCNLCVCTGWLPRPVGKITDFSRLEDIWNNPRAHEIQSDVTDKKFTWCAVEHCGIKHHNNYESTYQIVFAIDDSCNLQCPSCRREKRMYTEGPLYEEKLRAVQHTVDLLNKFDQRAHILFNCSGDPLASYISRPFLQSYVGNEKQTFTLFTNGILIKKLLPTTGIFPRITNYWISIDAGSPEVYEQVRVGGDWDTLMGSLDFLKEQGLSRLVTLQFVVQKNNFRDIPNFVQLLDKYNFKGILTNLDNWGTWNYDTVKFPDEWTIKNGTYREHNVLDNRHESYAECKTIVESVLSNRRLNFHPRLTQLLEIKKKQRV